MKAVILAGGYGTRIAEETFLKPKPMIEIGGRPILWHIMKMYSFYGVNEFIICCGYRGDVIKQYFSNYLIYSSDITIDFKNNETTFHSNNEENWKVTLVDTGQDTMTGGRLNRVKKYVQNEDSFFFTYGDGLSDVDIQETLVFHKAHGKIATLVAVNPVGRFGALELDDKFVSRFEEKPRGEEAYVNGGFFVLKNDVFNYISDNDACIWENEPLVKLAKNRELAAYRHNGFWQPMDTLKEKNLLENMWNSKKALWKVW